MPKLEWKALAIEDLLEIVDYISDNDPNAAQALKDEIEGKRWGGRFLLCSDSLRSILAQDAVRGGVHPIAYGGNTSRLYVQTDSAGNLITAYPIP